MGVYKALLLAGCAGTITLAVPAMAQDEPAPVGGEATTTEDTIVVTGSRIARRDFESNSPMVTVDEALLEVAGEIAIDGGDKLDPEQLAVAEPQDVPASEAGALGRRGHLPDRPNKRRQQLLETFGVAHAPVGQEGDEVADDRRSVGGRLALGVRVPTHAELLLEGSQRLAGCEALVRHKGHRKPE